VGGSREFPFFLLRRQPCSWCGHRKRRKETLPENHVSSTGKKKPCRGCAGSNEAHQSRHKILREEEQSGDRCTRGRGGTGRIIPKKTVFCSCGHPKSLRGKPTALKHLSVWQTGGVVARKSRGRKKDGAVLRSHPRGVGGGRLLGGKKGLISPF